MLLKLQQMEFPKPLKQYFTRQLMKWHEHENHRSLPWKHEKDPYKIWLSEIILQQTRAEQGLPYYLGFTRNYPTVGKLAAADDEEVFRLWQGLGYYNRCKNLLATARFISNELGGKFPDTYEAIINLKGIGPYTAAAISSFAFNMPHAVVDGNVNRVLARYFGIDTPFDSTEGKKLFQSLAQELLDKKNSAGYNQAIMDLGATVCTPQAPLCGQCALKTHCFAFDQGLTASLPVKSKKLTVKKRYFYYLLLRTEDKLWIHKRADKDIWQNLHEPMLIEHNAALNTKELLALPAFKSALPEFITKSPDSKSYKSPADVIYEGTLTQRLTHQLIETRFFTLSFKETFEIPQTEGKWVSCNELKNYAFPKTLVSFLEKKFYF